MHHYQIFLSADSNAGNAPLGGGALGFCACRRAPDPIRFARNRRQSPRDPASGRSACRLRSERNVMAPDPNDWTMRYLGTDGTLNDLNCQNKIRAFPVRAFLILASLAIPGVAHHCSEAQVSYQNSQSAAETRDGASAPRDSNKLLAPLRFRGWKYGANNPEYLKRFRRPRSGALFPGPRRPVSNVELNKALNNFGQHTSRAINSASGPNLPGFQPRPSVPAGYLPVSVAMGDFNGDGKMDWVVCNGGDNNLWVYLGRGDGTWQLPVLLPVAGLAPVWVAVGDFRGNGKSDIVVAEADTGSIGVFLGNGDGTFAAEQHYFLNDAPISLAVGDFNRDGKLNIMAGLAPNAGRATLAVLPGTGAGTFGTPLISKTAPTVEVTPEVWWISIGDLNNDGNPDAVIDLSGAILSFLGNGDGTFTQEQLIADPFIINYAAADVGDFNEDGCADVVVIDSLAHAITYTGDCSGTVTQQNQFNVGDIGLSVALRDVNGDGHLDIVTGTALTEEGIIGDVAGDLLSVMLGDGHGNFSEAAVYRGDLSLAGISLADLNGDGYLDIVSANQDSDTATVFLNDGKGGFGAPNGYALGYGIGTVNAVLSGFVQADLNGDGKQDLALLEFPGGSATDVQLTTMLGQGNGKFAPAVKYPAYPSSTTGFENDFVLADFRNTGHPDFLAVVAQPSAFFLSFAPNNGDGTFGPYVITPLSTPSSIMVVGDFNNDGKLDSSPFPAAEARRR